MPMAATVTSTQIKIGANARGSRVSRVLFVHDDGVVGHSVAGPSNGRILVLHCIVIWIKQAIGAVQRDSEFVAMIMAVALAHDMKNCDRFFVRPIRRRLV